MTAERHEDYGRVPTDSAARPAAPPDVNYLEELFRANYSELGFYAMAIVQDVATAEDVLQDSITAMYLRWGRDYAPESPQAYLYAVVRNMALSAVRQRERVELLSDIDHHDLFSEPAPASPEELAVASCGISIVLDEIARLPCRQREVLTLTMDEYSPAEIAEILGIEANAVRVHLHHARTKVRARLASTGVLAA